MWALEYLEQYHRNESSEDMRIYQPPSRQCHDLNLGPNNGLSI